MKRISIRRLLAVIMSLAMTALVAGQATAAPRVAAALYPPSCNLVTDPPIPPSLILNPTGDLYRISRNSAFFPGQSCSVGKSSLRMQTDGNFVLYDENNRARWATNTQGRGDWARFGADGNLIVYDINGQPVWVSNTCCHSDYFLAVQADGNVVIYQNGYIARWSTGTRH
ncbi:hypothetical protein [Streptomyces lushanensis]|uniref:hypothetical protein n=1 Tax=Streptomyces lushanensis TaxID=1434255 RepID=UPI0009A02B1F|nr:hypothetical protein [Streptomyces lushanensis]